MDWIVEKSVTVYRVYYFVLWHFHTCGEMYPILQGVAFLPSVGSAYGVGVGTI